MPLWPLAVLTYQVYKSDNLHQLFSVANWGYGEGMRRGGSGSRLKMKAIIGGEGGKEGGTRFFPHADQWGTWWAVFLWLLLDLLGACCRLPGCMLVSKGVLPEILSVCFSVALSP